MIVSPIRLVRNVPLSLRPLRRSWRGTDSDEYAGIETRGRVGACGGADVVAAIGGGADGGELPPGEAVVSSVPPGRPRESDASKCGTAVESCDLGADPHACVGADSDEIRRGDRRGL